MSARVAIVPAGQLEVGDLVAYVGRWIPDEVQPTTSATVLDVATDPFGLTLVALVLAHNGEPAHVYCGAGYPWMVERPAHPSMGLLPRPIFGCTWADDQDGTCGHPRAMTPECWLLEDGMGADCPPCSGRRTPGSARSANGHELALAEGRMRRDRYGR